MVLKCCFVISASCAILDREGWGFTTPRSYLQSLHRKVGFSVVKGVHEAVDLCCSVTAIFPAVIFHTTIGLRSWQGSEIKEIYDLFLMSVQNTTYTLLHVFITFQVTPCPMRSIQGAIRP